MPLAGSRLSRVPAKARHRSQANRDWSPLETLRRGNTYQYGTRMIYVGTFFIAFATLALEVTLSRLLSVITWYHLAFFAVSTAMLGMTAGATTVYLYPTWFTRNLDVSVVKSCLAFCISVPVALVLLCLMPMDIEQTVMSLFALILGTFYCATPFYFAGIAVTVILTKYELPIGKLYASDLFGASLGCLFVLGGLEILDACSLILLCGGIGGIAAYCFAWRSNLTLLRRRSSQCVVVLLVLSAANAKTSYGIRPFVVKGKIVPSEALLVERWNSHSRVAVMDVEQEAPQYWGASPTAPQETTTFQHHMNIDGLAGTTMRRFASVEDIDHLRFDVTNVAYYLRPDGGACVIGVGGGRDVQSAILFGHDRVTGIDVNPVFIDLLQNEFRQFAGIADRSGVELIAEEARSFLSASDGKYSLIQMSLVDTWAATGTGAFSLSENVLYTVEAWQLFISRLADDGVFTVSRWYSPGHLGEAGRMVSLAVASLFASGVSNPNLHIALVASERVATLIVSKEPLSNDDIAHLRELTVDLQFDLALVPGTPPKDAALGAISTASSAAKLEEIVSKGPLNYEPPTDNDPYFFNMLRLRHIDAAIESDTGVIRGNLVATVTLITLVIALAVVAAIAIVLPLLWNSFLQMEHRHRVFWPAALYFALIGAGFMFAEIALIQRLSVFLAHPVYGLGVLLFTLILSSGVGSYCSDRLPLVSQPWIYLCPSMMAVLIVGLDFLLSTLLPTAMTSAIQVKVLIAVLAISPVGVLMGFFFPCGMRLMKPARPEEVPWYWALNGVLGVLCAAVAVFISIYFGIASNFYISAVCYAGLIGCLILMRRESASQLVKQG